VTKSEGGVRKGEEGRHSDKGPCHTLNKQGDVIPPPPPPIIRYQAASTGKPRGSGPRHTRTRSCWGHCR
jgi:hypothetical protein